MLVESLDGVGGGEVSVVTIPCYTSESRLLEAAAFIETAVILHVGSEAFLSDVELTGNLSVGSLCEFTAEVDIHKVVPRAELVSLKLLKSDSNLLASSLCVRIKVATKVVMYLNVLCLCAQCCQEHEWKDE